jgi:hypothetical protein
LTLASHTFQVTTYNPPVQVTAVGGSRSKEAAHEDDAENEKVIRICASPDMEVGGVFPFWDLRFLSTLERMGGWGDAEGKGGR